MSTTTITRPTAVADPSTAETAVEEMIDGMSLFAENPFFAQVRRAAAEGRRVIVSIPDPSAGHLTGTSYALLHVAIEVRLRDALRRAGFTSVERSRILSSDCLIATK